MGDFHAHKAGTTAGEREIRLPRATGVKNKQPAEKQITAEQILRESRALQQDDFKAPTYKITDPEELKGERQGLLEGARGRRTPRRDAQCA